MIVASFPRSLDTNFQNRLRHKLSSVRLSKLNKAPVVEGKTESPKASKIPLVTVTVTDPSGQCVNAVDWVISEFSFTLSSVKDFVSCGFWGAVFAFNKMPLEYLKIWLRFVWRLISAKSHLLIFVFPQGNDIRGVEAGGEEELSDKNYSRYKIGFIHLILWLFLIAGHQNRRRWYSQCSTTNGQNLSFGGQLQSSTCGRREQVRRSKIKINDDLLHDHATFSFHTFRLNSCPTSLSIFATNLHWIKCYLSIHITLYLSLHCI